MILVVSKGCMAPWEGKKIRYHPAQKAGKVQGLDNDPTYVVERGLQAEGERVKGGMEINMVRTQKEGNRGRWDQTR